MSPAERLRRAQIRWARIPANVRGGLWILASAGLFTVMAALIKLAGKTFHVTEILLFRQFFMLLLILPVVIGNYPDSLQTKRADLQILRIVAALLAMLLSFTAFIHLPLAEVITISFSRTFFITIFAILMLHEIVGLRRWSAMIIGFGGVLIVAQPSVAAGMNAYGLMAIGGAACAALTMIIIRLLTRTDKPITILSHQAIGIGVLMIAPAIWFWKTPTLAQLALLAAIGVISAISQLCNIYGLRAAEASATAPLDYTRLIWAILFGIILFGEWPSANVYAGAVIIVSAGLFTMYREHRLGRQRKTKDAPPSV